MRPFKLPAEQLDEHLEDLVDSVFEDLTSQALLLPAGGDFVHSERFKEAYEHLRNATADFRDVTTDRVMEAVHADALAFVVLRTMVGLAPLELQDVAAEYDAEADDPVGFTSTAARGIDKSARTDRTAFPPGSTNVSYRRVRAMVATCCRLLNEGPPDVPADVIHRLDKVDTHEGLTSVQLAAEEGVSYSELLYERMLGRPFATHRDAVSERVGDVLEDAIEKRLQERGIPYYRTGKAEKVEGFEQAPDFFIPDTQNTDVVIEAKITNDDGTARDKATRIDRLAKMRDDRIRAGEHGFEVVACLDGRGFGVRRQDMRNMIVACGGKVFTTDTLDDLVDNTRLRDHATK